MEIASEYPAHSDLPRKILIVIRIFAKNVVDFIVKYNLDGVDFDGSILG